MAVNSECEMKLPVVRGQVPVAVVGSSSRGLSFIWIKQKSDCFFYLSGLREGDHCAINCCLDKLNSGRLLNIKIKLGRMVESSRCVSIVEATLPLA